MTKSYLRIGAIGWWSYDNQGDLAMLTALTQGLAPHQVVPIDIGFPAHPDSIYRLNQQDFILVGGGTLIPGIPAAPFDTFEQWADQLDCPFGVVGLGVDPIRDPYWPAVVTLLNRAYFFYVRDRASKTLLGNHPKVQIAPDITFAYPLHVGLSDDRQSGGAPKCGVHLRKSPGLDPRPWLDAISKLPVEVKGIPFSSFDFWSEAELLRQLDPQTPDHFDPTLYRQIDLMIATAFHAVLFAVQAEVPVIAINYSPKVRHFMTENGFENYLLAQDEHERLSRVVDEVLTHRHAIIKDLQETRKRLHLESRRNMEDIKDQIERCGRYRERSGPRVSVIVMKSGHHEGDQRTLNSCREQTYPEVEILVSTPEDEAVPLPSSNIPPLNVIGTKSHSAYASRLRRMLSLASGHYVTWVNGGDWLAKDTLDCLISLLETGKRWDLVYTDYYVMNEANLPIGRHWAATPAKLFRRDVVGPCFLMRKSLLAEIGLPSLGTPLPAYELWLRIKDRSRLLGFHAPLFYSALQDSPQRRSEQERAVRQDQRKDARLATKVLWSVIDSDLFERHIVRPLACFLRLISKMMIKIANVKLQ